MGRYLLFGIVLAGAMCARSQSLESDRGLVAYWPFDQVQKGAILEDVSVHALHGKSSGAMPVHGIRGSGLKFDGRDDFVTILNSGGRVPAHLAMLEEGTLSLWFKLDVLPEGKGIQPLFYFGSWTACTNMFDAANQGLILEVGHHPVHMDSRRLYFTVFSNGCTGPSLCFDSWHDLEADRWYHFAVVVGPDFNRGYLDGLPMEFIHYTFGNETYSQFFMDARRKDVIWVGKGFWDGETHYLDGMVDEVRIYNRPLSDPEVNELYHATLATDLPAARSDSRVILFPNPVRDHLSVSWQNQRDQEPIQSMLILDSQGKVWELEAGAKLVDVSKLEKGYYLIQLVSRSGVVRLPFVKTE